MIIEAKSLNISKLSPTIYKKFTSSLPSGVIPGAKGWLTTQTV